MAKFLVGVDEAGRGPIAGPVAVGIIVAPARFDISKSFPGVADSKKLNEKKREEIFKQLQDKSGKGKQQQEKAVLRYIVVFASAKMIDVKGISFAVRHSIYKGIKALAPDPKEYKILLDGLLKAPPEYVQQTIIGGDATEPIISLASIAAKVTRDRLMKRLAKKYPGFGFEVHKGYGTPKHYAAIRAQGLCELHRRSYGLGGMSTEDFVI